MIAEDWLAVGNVMAQYCTGIRPADACRLATVIVRRDGSALGERIGVEKEQWLGDGDAGGRFTCYQVSCWFSLSLPSMISDTSASFSSNSSMMISLGSGEVGSVFETHLRAGALRQVDLCASRSFVSTTLKRAPHLGQAIGVVFRSVPCAALRT
jgi:hypothetical protein